MTAERSARRRRRAAIVRRLAELRDVAGAGDPRWHALSWHGLDALPDWCALAAPARRERVAIAGAVALLPAIRRCLRGEVLLRLRELIGPERLDALRCRPYRSIPSDTELADVAGLERQLAGHGVRVLLAEVDDPLARALLFEALSAEHAPHDGAGTTSGDDATPHERERQAVADIDPQAGLVAARLHEAPATTTTVRVSASRRR